MPVCHAQYVYRVHTIQARIVVIHVRRQCVCVCVVRKPSFWHCDYDDDGVPSYVPAYKTSFSRIVLYKSRVVLNGIPSHVSNIAVYNVCYTFHVLYRVYVPPIFLNIFRPAAF